MSSVSWKTLPRRFESKLSQVGDCWVWTGARTADGYGHISIGAGICRLAHRVSWELHRGPIPDGLHIDHLCRNPPCVNPDHLEPVPPAVNAHRGVGPSAMNARKTHCLRGHPFVGENLKPDKSQRRCRKCDNDRRRAADELARGRPALPPPAERTHCPKGHPYSAENTYVAPGSNARHCKECSRERSRNSKRERRLRAALEALPTEERAALEKEARR